MALIKCKNCGKEISSKAKKCPHCSIKLNKKEKQSIDKSKIINKLISIFSIILFIIMIIICTLFLLNFITFGVYTSSCSKPQSDYTIFNIMIFIVGIIQIFMLIKEFKIKSHNIIKIFSILSLVAGIICIGVYSFNYFEASKYDFNVSIKTLVKEGKYDMESAKNINKKIDEIIYPYSCWSIPLTKIDNIENGEQVFYFNSNSINEGISFDLNLKIENNKIENMYWNYSENTKIYLYKNYEITNKAKYYAKVLRYTSGNENCLTCNYLKNQIINDIKEKDFISYLDVTYFNTLFYDKNDDIFYYGINIDNNKTIKAYLKDKENHELDYSVIVENN